MTAEITGIYVRRVERRAMPLPLEQKIFDTAWVASPEHRRARRRSAWKLAGAGSDGADAGATADEFAAQWRSSVRRVITANLSDESAVLAAFAETGADADRPPAGVVIFVACRLRRTWARR